MRASSTFQSVGRHRHKEEKLGESRSNEKVRGVSFPLLERAGVQSLSQYVWNIPKSYLATPTLLHTCSQGGQESSSCSLTSRIA